MGRGECCLGSSGQGWFGWGGRCGREVRDRSLGRVGVWWVRMDRDASARELGGVLRLRDGGVWPGLSWRDRWDRLVLAIIRGQRIERCCPEDHVLGSRATWGHVEGH